MANTYTALATVTVGAGGAATIDFQNIPQTYTDLALVSSLRGSTTSPDVYIRVNNTTVNYRTMLLYNNGGTVASISSTTNPGFYSHRNRSSYTANVFSNNYAYIPNYTNQTTTKVTTSDMAPENNATSLIGPLATTSFFSQMNPITRLTLINDSGVFEQYSTATLYGILNADVSSAPSSVTIGTATAGMASASIAFTGGTNAGSYTATSSPGGITGSGDRSPIIVTGLTNGTAYTFTITARNPFGTTTSSATGSATPTLTNGNIYFNFEGGDSPLTMFRFDFAYELITSFGFNLTPRFNGIYSCNSGVAGYMSGGNVSGSLSSTSYKMTIPAEVFSTLSNTLPAANIGTVQATQNTGTASYLFGGASAGFATRYRTVVKMPYSTEAFTQLGSSFTNLGNGLATTADGHVAAYSFGGYDDPSPSGPHNAINRLTFSSDAFSSGVATLGATSYNGMALSNDGSAAYYFNGIGTATWAQKFVYSTNTRSTLTTSFTPNDRSRMNGGYKLNTAGYILGNVDNDRNSIIKFVYSGETHSTLALRLPLSTGGNLVQSWNNNGVW